jgi:hypothetical protein
MSENYLITDCAGYASLSLNESAKGGSCIFEGKFQEADAVNKNKRLYKKHTLERNVERLQEFIDRRMLLSALDHPSTSTQLIETACALITKLWWEGNNLMGRAEVLRTPNGTILKNLLESGVTCSISSRGLGQGTTRADGVLEIADNYQLITFDVVCEGSVYGSYLKKVESANPINLATSEVKNESATLNKVNVNTLISYFGELVNRESQLIKETIKHE